MSVKAIFDRVLGAGRVFVSADGFKRRRDHPEALTMQPDDDVICRCADRIVELIRRLPPEDIHRLREVIVPILVGVVELHQADCWKARRKLGPCKEG